MQTVTTPTDPAQKLGSIRVLVLAGSPVRLWGLTARERLERLLRREGIGPILSEGTVPGEGGSVLLLRGDYLYDERVLGALLRCPDVLLREGPDGPVAGAHVGPERVELARQVVLGARPPEDLADVRVQTPQSLAPSYQKRLRKHDPPFMARVTPEGRRALEDRLFSASYKGVTDLITKWVWPVPARWATRLCAHYRVHPTAVTGLGLALVIAAGFLFARGDYAPALALAWVMTFLDTVDGKLARVTIRSSEVGNVLDHGIDLIHPPLWYLAWGAGLDRFAPPLVGLTLSAALWIIVVGYVLGRLVQGAFHLWMGPFSIFLWRRVDSCFRLVTARRNPNLILLTGSVLAGRPDLGLFAVAAWTAISTAILLVRLGMAARERLTSGPLRPWMLDISPEARRHSLVVRLFVTGPAAS